MDLSKILSIAGKGGLFKVVSQGKNSVIVESLQDKKRIPAFGHEKISSLEEIAVFTNGEDMPLKDVFKAIFEKMDGKEAIDHKSDNAALKKFFLEIIPDYDQERVYVSDIKKIINWYNLLILHELLDFTEPEPETEKPETTEPSLPEAIASGTTKNDSSASETELPLVETPAEELPDPEKKTTKPKSTVSKKKVE